MFCLEFFAHSNFLEDNSVFWCAFFWFCTTLKCYNNTNHFTKRRGKKGFFFWFCGAGNALMEMAPSQSLCRRNLSNFSQSIQMWFISPCFFFHFVASSAWACFLSFFPLLSFSFFFFSCKETRDFYLSPLFRVGHPHPLLSRKKIK